MRAPGRCASSVNRRPSSYSTTWKRSLKPERNLMRAFAPSASGSTRVACSISAFHRGHALASAYAVFQTVSAVTLVCNLLAVSHRLICWLLCFVRSSRITVRSRCLCRVTQHTDTTDKYFNRDRANADIRGARAGLAGAFARVVDACVEVVSGALGDRSRGERT